MRTILLASAFALAAAAPAAAQSCVSGGQFVACPPGTAAPGMAQGGLLGGFGSAIGGVVNGTGQAVGGVVDGTGRVVGGVAQGVTGAEEPRRMTRREARAQQRMARRQQQQSEQDLSM